ncbi:MULTISPECIES: MarC family NAAT transporter [Providencia]|uniref:MarC family NAAT transporter n=1 Tax=Providencia TaxID=586 RepID=UPI001980F0EC|nr:MULTISPECIES: MarC family NAAT transporter [Providencia]HEC8330654.1 MarC family NAAT transporter [Providencia rettgeri]MBN4865284.1 MarC family NAAT transporter [Providencia stuartii]MBN4874490.1 MarC family NAAT transporter [Providencia stuartii]MBN4879297.1 MarC family NAAT transporter [Providencia stuartii]MBN4883691.1 MarC family NAAT transporter [Providencia stuartii]
MTNFLELFQAVGIGLVLLLPLANPLTAIAVMLSISANMTKEQRNHQAFLASIYVFAIMTIAFYAGQLVMNTFGISIPGLRIAGGLIVAFIGFGMLFPNSDPSDDSPTTPLDDPSVPKKRQESPNIAFVPLAMPSTAGPGTIAMIISSTASLQGNVTFAPWVLKVAPVITFLLASLIVWIGLRGATSIMRWLGNSGIDAIARVMGFLLICMGVQFVINGIVEIIAQLPHLLTEYQ